MGSFSLTTSTNLTNFKSLSATNPLYINNYNLQRKFVSFATSAANDNDNDSKKWDKIEVKFGQSNSNFTLPKMKDRKLNPEYGEGKQPREQLAKAPNTNKHSVPNVVLWNATSFEKDDDESNMSSSLSLKPNLSLNMGREEGKERFTDMILVRNSEPSMKNNKVGSTVDTKDSTCKSEQVDEGYGDHSRSKFSINYSDHRSSDLEPTSQMGNVAGISSDPLHESRDNTGTDSTAKLSSDATLQGRPKRLDQSQKELSDIDKENTRIGDLITEFIRSENLPPIPLLKDREDMDWKRADDLLKTSGRAEVEMIRCSTRGFVISFGSLIGFLPYRNLATKWKFLAFESWLRNKGLDPSTYRKSLGIIGNYNATTVDPEKFEGEFSSHMKLEDLFALYDQEKLEYLSTFIGQKIKVNVVLADRESKKLIFSVKPKEQEESIQRKRNLMTKLKVGDIVTCCIKKISYFGIFVEIEGVPALIHQTEVSWDATPNPTLSFKIGQVIEAKVHQLDFSLERIYMSLKEITPDPLTGSLEAVFDDRAVSDSTLEAGQPEREWADLELLVNELRQYEGVELVTKGRFFLSPSLTPTFQVYMASMFKNQYKLLARAGNKVQEVVVQTWLGTEDMKHAILRCTGRVK